MSKALLSVTAVFLLAANSHVGAAALTPFNIGPYRLGMTNAEAAKFGLSNCTPDSIHRFMECDGALQGEFADKPLRLSFDMKTKRLERMKAVFRDWASDDERIPRMRADLKIEPCPPNSGSPTDWYLKEECHALPDNYRTIRWDPGRTWRHQVSVRHIEVSVMRSAGRVKEFFGKKQSAVDQRQRNADFAAGK